MRVICQCESVDFDIPQPRPLAINHCHGTRCQRQSASALGTSAVFPSDGVFPLPPPPGLREKLRLWTRPSKEGRSMDCYFCEACGVRVMHRIRNADGSERPTVSVKGGVVDGLDWSRGVHISAGSAVVPVPDGAERWEGSPEPVVDGGQVAKPSSSGSM